MFCIEEILSLSKRAVLIADEQVAAHYMEEVLGRLRKGGGEVLGLVFPAGEEQKTRRTVERLQDEMLKLRLGRDVVVVGLGGGVTCDVAGYLASTYLRGVPLVLVPTSLLAMVDAAFGGKTGVNTPFGKNQIGTFYPADEVVIDLKYLKTLPQKEWENGYAEVVKYGLIADPQLLNYASMDLKEVIERCIAIKRAVVEGDPEEKRGRRRILNFGHTVGHALEVLSGYSLSHGEAVAIGCFVESHLSAYLGLLPKEALARVPKRKVPFLSGLYEAMQGDKKAKGGQARFVLLEEIGVPCPFGGEYCKAVSKEEFEACVSNLVG